MTITLLFTWSFWLVVVGVMLRRKHRWWWAVLGVPVAFTGAYFGIAHYEPGFAAVFIIGMQLTMAPRLIWTEVLRERNT
jgi:drug/metabolite transporter (DMT)-like permease